MADYETKSKDVTAKLDSNTQHAPCYADNRQAAATQNTFQRMADSRPDKQPTFQRKALAANNAPRQTGSPVMQRQLTIGDQAFENTEAVDGLLANDAAEGVLLHIKQSMTEKADLSRRLANLARSYSFTGHQQFRTALQHAEQPRDLRDYLSAEDYEAVTVALAASADQRRALREQIQQTESNEYGDCGATELTLRARLAAVNAETNQTTRNFSGADDADNFEALLNPAVDNPTLYQITIGPIHVFTLEKRPNGHICLSQGYQGQYNALWWAGAELGGHAEMGDTRAAFGLGQNISGTNIVTLTGNMLRAGTWDNQDAKMTAWRALPCFAGDSAIEALGNDDPITARVVRIELTNNDAIMQALDRDDTEFATQAILQNDIDRVAGLRTQLGELEGDY